MKPGDPKPDPAQNEIVTRVHATLFAGESALKAETLGVDRTMAPGELVFGPGSISAGAAGDRYIPHGELGRGGMGRVAVVFDRALGRHVAQKEVLEERIAALLVAEAQICAQLEHPSIVPVYDLTTGPDGLPRYTMRVVRGRCLADILDEAERPPLAQLLGVLRQVCLAVDYAHSRGVVHRDLKPHNILVGSFGEVYVLDWGVAHVLEGSDLHRAPGLPELPIAGTPQYMSPEQLEGRVGPFVDVYALGAILYEVLVGERAFPEATNIRSIRARKTAPPPSHAAQGKRVPPAFDALVTSCLSRSPDARPESARAIADAIDAYLDGERERAEREREAASLCAEGEGAWAKHEQLVSDAEALEARAQELLSELAPHDPLEKKKAAWALEDRARRAKAEAAHALARAEIVFSTALGRVRDYAEARAGLARIHLSQFVEAEKDGDRERMARHLDLARSYDDGALARELADQGEIEIASRPSGALVTIHRYETEGPLLVLGEPREWGPTPAGPRSLPSGSYVAVVQHRGREVRYPVRIERARLHRLEVRLPDEGELPEGMVLIPGGPFLATGRTGRLEERTLPDFALARFPVTMAAYAEWLDALGEAGAQLRVPRDAHGPHLELSAGRWRVSSTVVDSSGRPYVPVAREGDLPVHGITWYSAQAYAAWLAARTGLSYRLPTVLEWEKAMRGADGRPVPMGTQLDPCFAKIRQSRPEGSQVEPVGAFRLDESPYGVRDLAGGVADWTSTMVDGGRPPSVVDEGDPRADERQAYWVGGHWGVMGLSGAPPPVPMAVKHRNNGVGFRLALSLDQNGSSSLVVEPMR